MKLPPDVLNLLAIAGIVVGLIECFFGYRIFKLVLGLTGFLVAGVGAAAVAYTMSQDTAIALLAGLVGGVLGALLFVTLYFVGIFCFGALLGALAGAALQGVVPEVPEPALLLVPALLGGVLALVFQKLMIIVSTAFNGAGGVVAAAAHLLTGAAEPADFEKLLRPGDQHRAVLILSWLVLGAVGVICQYRSAPTPKKEKDD